MQQASSISVDRTVIVKSQKFLTAIFAPYPEPGLIELRVLRPQALRKSGNPVIYQNWYTNSQQGRNLLFSQANRFDCADCYFGYLPRTERKGHAQAVRYAAWLFVGIDGHSAGVDGAIALLKHSVKWGKVPKPSILVNSGHGLHAYWALPEVLIFERDCDREEYGKTLRRLALTIGLGKGPEPACDAATIAQPPRLPGTFNRKDLYNPLPVSILRFQPDYAPWPYSYWIQKLDKEPVPKIDLNSNYGYLRDAMLPPYLMQQLCTPALEGNRHKTLCRILTSMRKGGFDEPALLLVAEHFGQNNPGFPTREIRGAVKWALQAVTPNPYQPQRQGV